MGTIRGRDEEINVDPSDVPYSLYAIAAGCVLFNDGNRATSKRDAMSETVPAQSFRIIRKFIPGKLQPLLRGLRRRFRRPNEEPYRTIFPYSQAHPDRQRNLVRMAEEIERLNIPGAVVECGVLDGGTAALMAWATRQSGREVHLFDSWQGMPETSEKDGAEAAIWVGDIVGSASRVRAVMRKLQVAPLRVSYHCGWFDQTFPLATQIKQIALLHIDADFYESVRLSLETWFPKLSPGGYVQFDDYSSFIGCKIAVDEFLVRHPELRLQTNDGISFFLQTVRHQTTSHNKQSQSR
jgi:O-methyltransferase